MTAFGMGLIVLGGLFLAFQNKLSPRLTDLGECERSEVILGLVDFPTLVAAVSMALGLGVVVLT